MARAFGLAIGTSLIKLIQLDKNGEKPVLRAYGWVQNPVGVIFSEVEEENQKLAEVIKKMIEERGVEGRRVVISLPESKIYTRVIEMPRLSEAELASAINWEAEQYVPVPLKEINLSWEIVRTLGKRGEEEKMEVFLVAAPKRLVDQAVELLDKVGLEPVAIEPAMVAVSRALGRPGGVVAVVQMGWRSTEIAVVDDEMVGFVHSLSTGGEALTRALADNLGLEFSQAEEYRRTYGFDREQLEGKVAKAMDPVFIQLTGELKKALDFFSSKNPEKKINTVLLSGGVALTPGITAAMAESLNREVELANPFTHFAGEIPGEVQQLAPVLSEAVGLALWED